MHFNLWTKLFGILVLFFWGMDFLGSKSCWTFFFYKNINNNNKPNHNFTGLDTIEINLVFKNILPQNCQKLRIKITRRTTGARGCYFQTSVYQVIKSKFEFR